MSEMRRNYDMNGVTVPARPVGKILSKSVGQVPGAGPDVPGRRFTHKITRTITIDLSIARSAALGNALVIPFAGSFVHCPWSTNATDLVMVQLDLDSDPIPVTRHYSCSGNGYQQLTITNQAIAAATLYLVLALETMEERLQVL